MLAPMQTPAGASYETPATAAASPCDLSQMDGTSCALSLNPSVLGTVNEDTVSTVDNEGSQFTQDDIMV